MDPITFKGKSEPEPDLDNSDFLAQFPGMINQAVGIKWLDSKVKLQRYLGNSNHCKNIIGLIETLNRPFVVFNPTLTSYRVYNWLNW